MQSGATMATESDPSWWANSSWWGVLVTAIGILGGWAWKMSDRNRQRYNRIYEQLAVIREENKRDRHTMRGALELKIEQGMERQDEMHAENAERLDKNFSQHGAELTLIRERLSRVEERLEMRPRGNR